MKAFISGFFDYLVKSRYSFGLKDFIYGVLLGLITFYGLSTVFQSRFSPSAQQSLSRFNPFIEKSFTRIPIPERKGWVTDTGSFIAADRIASLSSQLDRFHRDRGITFYILVVPNLQRVSIEEYAEQVFNNWKIGTAKDDNGLLLVLCPPERKTRLEVGYGLEGDIPDIRAKEFISYGRSKFQSGDFGQGLQNIVNALTHDRNRTGESWEQQTSYDDFGPPLMILGLLFLMGIFPIYSFVYLVGSVFLSLFLLRTEDHSVLYSVFLFAAPHMMPLYTWLRDVLGFGEPWGTGSSSYDSWSSTSWDSSSSSGDFSSGGGSSGGDSGGSSGGGGASDSW